MHRDFRGVANNDINCNCSTFSVPDHVVSRSQTSFLAQGIIAYSISARTKKGLVWFTVLTRS